MHNEHFKWQKKKTTEDASQAPIVLAETRRPAAGDRRPKTEDPDPLLTLPTGRQAKTQAIRRNYYVAIHCVASCLCLGRLLMVDC